MECKAVGDPKPDIRWYKEKLQIISNDKFTVYTDDGGVCTLTVEDVTYEDEGMYKAIASNNAGKVSCVAKLIVKGMLLLRRDIKKSEFLSDHMFSLKHLNYYENIRMYVKCD